jgi:hypothetical protein
VSRLSPNQWARVISAESRALHIPITAREEAEGIGVVEAESGGDPKSNPAGNEHKGAWAESRAFGTLKQRLDPFASTAAALKQWAADKKSWWQAWGQYETGETEGAGPTRWKQYIGVASAALGAKNTIAIQPGAFASPATATVSPRSGTTGASSDLMHFALVAILVLGGIALVGFGAMRLIKGPA